MGPVPGDGRFVGNGRADQIEYLREHGFDFRAVGSERGIALAMAGDAEAKAHGRRRRCAG